MIESTAPTTTDIADDERLIELLGEISSGPAERAMALRALSSLPSSVWTLDRVAGAVGTIVPQAHAEADDELAFLTWNVLASLMAHGQTLTGEALPFEDQLVELLVARSPEIRGFAATNLGRTTARASARAVAEAVVVEERWDVAIRGIAALTMASVPLPASVLIEMLNAPTQEAVAFAARALGAAGTLEARPEMLRLLAGAAPLDETTERELRRAVGWLDGAEAEILAVELFPDCVAIEGGGLVLAQGGGRAAGFSLQFSTQTNIISLELNLPVDGCEETVAALADAIGTLLSDETNAKGRVAQDDNEYVLKIAPALPAPSSLSALVQVCALLTPACELADRRSVGLGVVISALDSVTDEIHARAARHAALASRLPSTRRLRTDDGTRWTLLGTGSGGVDSEGAPQVTWVLAADTDQLWADAAAAALLVVLSWSQETRLDFGAEASDRIAAALGWRVGLPLIGQVLDTSPPLLAAAGVPAGDIHVQLEVDARALRKSLQRPGAGSGSERFRELMDQSESMEFFLRGYCQRVADGEDPAELLNLQALQKIPWEAPVPPEASSIDDAPATSPHQPPVEEATQEFEVSVLDDHPTDDFTDLAALRRPPTPGVLVEDPDPLVDYPTSALPTVPQPPTHPSRAAQSRPRPIASNAGDPERPRQPQRPPGPSGGNAPLDDQGRTPADVVKQLSADLVTVDVYLRSAGYNHAKLAQIMTILLGHEPDAARAIIAKAPCRLLTAVPRDRARTIKTVLEGTGAIIAWEEPDDE